MAPGTIVPIEAPREFSKQGPQAVYVHLDHRQSIHVRFLGLRYPPLLGRFDRFVIHKKMISLVGSTIFDADQKAEGASFKSRSVTAPTTTARCHLSHAADCEALTFGPAQGADRSRRSDTVLRGSEINGRKNTVMRTSLTQKCSGLEKIKSPAQKDTGVCQKYPSGGGRLV
jgi:hypothetical protein